MGYGALLDKESFLLSDRSTYPTQDLIMNRKIFKYSILLFIFLGIFFRFFNLDYKVYWFDEVYSTYRIAGFTNREIDREIFADRIVTPESLQKHQQIKPETTVVDTVKTLITEDTKHPPLYYVLARFWMERFGNAIAIFRMLPALLSLLSLPLIYALAKELFATRFAAEVATAFLALSPFDILFAQTVRQYSLLTVALLGSSLLLLRAVRLRSWKNWMLYGILCTLGLYTHLFFVLTLFAQGLYVCLLKTREILFKFLGAIALTLLLYSPWLSAIALSHERAISSSDWTKASVGLLYLIKFWILGFTSPFFDLDFGIDSFWTYAIRLPVAICIFASLYLVFRRTSRSTYLFIFTAIFVPFLILALPDLVIGGKRSSVTRYLICSFPGIQLAVAYFFAQKLPAKQGLWKGLFALVLTGSILSCAVSAFSPSWWSKGVSVANAEVAEVINRVDRPLVISDRGNSWTNKGNLISLSYLLDEDVRLLLLSYPPQPEVLATFELPENAKIFLYQPTQKLREELETRLGSLQYSLKKGGLLQPRSPSR